MYRVFAVDYEKGNMDFGREIIGPFDLNTDSDGLDEELIAAMAAISYENEGYNVKILEIKN